MKNKFKVIITVLLAALFSAALFACTPKEVKQPTVEEKFTELLSSFEAVPCHTVTGKIFKDGNLISDISAVTHLPEKKIILNVNEENFYYGETFLCKKDDDYIIEKSETDYRATLDTFMPFVIHNYVYNPLYRGEIYYSDGKYIVTFLNKGVKNSFSTPLNVNGGVLSVICENGEIVGSTLTTTVTENNVSYSLYCHYSYLKSDYEFTEKPWVRPTDSIGYAQYALKTLASHNLGKTLWTSSGKKNTEVSLGAIPVTSAVVKNVSSIVQEDGTATLFIDYSEKQIIVGLSSSMQSFKIIYDKNYEVKSITINDSVNYYLQ